ncbi:MAG: hypothetical protein AABZ60_13725, partial [Planctomycetota bacterium]
MFVRKTLFWIFVGLISSLGMTLQAQPIRVDVHLPQDPYYLGKPYSLWIEVDSTEPGSFSVPQIEESPLFELKFIQHTAYSFVENDQNHFGIRFEYQFVPKKVGEVRLIPKIDWTSQSKQETFPCPPKHIVLQLTSRRFYQHREIDFVLGFLMALILILWRLKKTKKAQQKNPEKPCEMLLLEKLSELARFRM